MFENRGQLQLKYIAETGRILGLMLMGPFGTIVIKILTLELKVNSSLTLSMVISTLFLCLGVIMVTISVFLIREDKDGNPS